MALASSSVSVLEGQSTSRPPLFNGSNFSYWKTRMSVWIQGIDYELWEVVLNGPFVPKKGSTDDDGNLGKVLKEPKDHVPYLPGDSNIAVVDEVLRSREEQIREVKKHLLNVQEKMKYFSDRNRDKKEYAVGYWVYLKFHPFKQRSLPHSRTHKLSSKYAGPFQITERIGPVAYKLKLPSQAKIHDVFHIVLLKKKVGIENITSELHELMRESPLIFEPEAVLDRGIMKAKRRAIPEVSNGSPYQQRMPPGNQVRTTLCVF